MRHCDVQNVMNGQANVLLRQSIISEEDLSSQQSMEEDIDADSRTNRSRPCEQEGDLNRKRKSKLGDAAKVCVPSSRMSPSIKSPMSTTARHYANFFTAMHVN